MTEASCNPSGRLVDASNRVFETCSDSMTEYCVAAPDEVDASDFSG